MQVEFDWTQDIVNLLYKFHTWSYGKITDSTAYELCYIAISVILKVFHKAHTLHEYWENWPISSVTIIKVSPKTTKYFFQTGITDALEHRLHWLTFFSNSKSWKRPFVNCSVAYWNESGGDEIFNWKVELFYT